MGGKRREKIEITGLRQKMERADREKPPAHPPLQERKWSVQGRQNSKPPLSTPQQIHLMCVERRSAYFFFLRRDKVVLHVTKERDWGSTERGMKDETLGRWET